MTDLFSWQPPYPATPGYKEPTTSKDAAKAIEPKARGLRGMCLAAIEKQPGTPDEIADRLGLTVLSVRPRITELKELGLIEQTGVRRKNASGRDAHVWRVVA